MNVPPAARHAAAASSFAAHLKPNRPPAFVMDASGPRTEGAKSKSRPDVAVATLPRTSRTTGSPSVVSALSRVVA
jgi:hypothetical protein